MSDGNQLMIEIGILRDATQRILDELEREKKQIDVSNRDQYWVILSPHCYDFSKVPDEFGVGDLIDDWTALKNLATSKTEVSLIADLDNLAAILRAVSDELMDTD